MEVGTCSAGAGLGSAVPRGRGPAAPGAGRRRGALSPQVGVSRSPPVSRQRERFGEARLVTRGKPCSFVNKNPDPGVLNVHTPVVRS